MPMIVARPEIRSASTKISAALAVRSLVKTISGSFVCAIGSGVSSRLE